MPVIVNRRMQKISIGLDGNRRIVLKTGGSEKIDAKDITAYAVIKAQADGDITIIPDAVAPKSSPKNNPTE